VEAYQWFLLGVMVTWPPSLVVLALMLRKGADRRFPMSDFAPLLGISGSKRNSACHWEMLTLAGSQCVADRPEAHSPKNYALPGVRCIR
jgi:hypothetical protein